MGALAALNPYSVGMFAAAALIASIGAVLLSGFFPRAARPVSTQGLVGAALVWSGVGLSAALAALALMLAIRELPWAVAVVAAGLAFLSAPFVVQPVPSTLRDSKVGLGLFLAIAAGALASLYSFVYGL